MGDAPLDHQLKLFHKSVAKQAKWKAITAMLDTPVVQSGLDLGSDNGVISYLLRQRGGTWHSADLSQHAVASIRNLVNENVHQIDGRTLPFPDEHFDAVVVIDLLEHVEDDRGLIREICRVLRPGGRAILNVPHMKRFSLLRRLRLILGLTDAWHGHLRPGYTLAGLRKLLAGCFEMRKHRTYNKFFCELLDIILNFLFLRKSGAAAGESLKGTIVTAETIARHEKSFRLYRRLYPLMWLFTRLDLLAWPFKGYSLIISAEKKADCRDR